MRQGMIHVRLDFPWLLSGVLFVAYLCWGVHCLRRRLSEHADDNFVQDGITLCGVLLFYIFEFYVLDEWMSNSPLRLLLAVFALFVSGGVLYGPTAVAFASHLVVDMVMPSREENTLEPQYGAGEACEQQGNFEQAVAEYMAVARMFPKDATAALRVGDNLTKIGQMAEATTWLERGLAQLEAPGRALTVTNRLFQIYQTDLEQPEKAREMLETYLARFPEAEYAESVQRRLERLAENA